MRSALNEAQLAISFRIFLFCNIILAVLFFFAFVESIGAVIRGGDVRRHIEDLVSLPLYLLIAFGLKKQLSWVRPLICWVSCFSILRMLLVMVSEDLMKTAANPVAIVFVYLFNGVFILFYAYQLYFFSRSDVKAFFKRLSAAGS